jgi:hypothetical protein
MRMRWLVAPIVLLWGLAAPAQGLQLEGSFVQGARR